LIASFIIEARLYSTFTMKALLLSVAFFSGLPGLAPAQLEEVDGGYILDLIGGVDWADRQGQAYSSKKILELSLSNADLLAHDITEISRMKEVDYLRLGIGPEGVTLLTQDLSPLAALSNLKTLHLCITNVEGRTFNFLPELKNLESLKIESHYQIQWRCDPSFFETIASVKTLKNFNSALDGADDQAVDILTRSGNLESLELWGGTMTDAAAAKILRNPRLKTLGLNSDQLTDRFFEEIATLRDLTKVTVRSGKTTPQAVLALRHLKSLQGLELTIKRSTPEMFSVIRHLESLERLRLDGCLVSEADVALLKGHPGLKAIWLNQAKATDETKKVIRSLPRMEYGTIGEWNISPDK
jgi:Leucine-rich repeat (LRR) protein